MSRLPRLLKLFGAAVVLLVVMAPLPAAGLSEADAQQLFEEANSQFRRGNELSRTNPIAAKEAYRSAVIRFERIVEEGGVRNGRLLYNIGNAYFRLNDIGRAILNYRRAEQFIAGDANLAQNLRYARSRRVDQIEEKQETQVLRTLLFWHYDLPPGTRFSVFAAFFVAFWGLASARLFFADRVRRAVVAAFGAIAAVLLGSLVLQAATGNRDGVIVAEQVVARIGDGDSYEPRFNEPLHAGAEFALVEDRGEWRQVELADGQRCWIPATATALVDGG